MRLNFNQGAMPHEMFLRPLQRFGDKVWPRFGKNASRCGRDVDAVRRMMEAGDHDARGQVRP